MVSDPRRRFAAPGGSGAVGEPGARLAAPGARGSVAGGDLVGDLVETLRSGAVPDDLPSAVAALTRSRGLLLGPGPLAELVRSVADELVGAGPLQPWLDDPDVTDVLVNGPRDVWVEARGRLLPVEVDLGSPARVRALAVRLAALGGRRLDDASPTVDARLPDGTRLHAVLPPLAGDCTLISLRVVRRRAFSLAELVTAGTVPQPWAPLLEHLVRARANLLISGATGSGKTTLLAAMLSRVPPDERVLVVEESAELSVDHPHVLRLTTREANVDGAGRVGLRELLRNALRMRPDRIVLGECRGDEVRDVLAALGTGHAGGCATLHASSAAEVPVRIEALALAAGLPPAAIGAQLCTAFDVVLHLQRSGAQRRLAEVGVVERAADGSAQVLVALSDDAPPGRGPGWESLVERWPGPWVEPLVSANRARLAVVGGAS